jgi:hypothetical protein
LYQDVREDQALLLEQLWASEVEMASESPEIRFDTILNSHGIEVIDQVRA